MKKTPKNAMLYKHLKKEPHNNNPEMERTFLSNQRQAKLSQTLQKTRRQTSFLQRSTDMDNHTPEQRKKNMQAVHNKDSGIELVLRKALWNRGLRYRKNVKTVFGHPDIAFIGKKVAVFCDSEFWHGFDWEHKSSDIKTNREFWVTKIERNIKRDQEVNKVLEEQGWIVVRFWGKEIKKNTEACVDMIVRVLGERNNAI